jgi:hypothetical protein
MVLGSGLLLFCMKQPELQPRFYPVILIAWSTSIVQFKIVYNEEGYHSFCDRYPDLLIRQIKTLESIYLEYRHKGEIKGDQIVSKPRFPASDDKTAHT